NVFNEKKKKKNPHLCGTAFKSMLEADLSPSRLWVKRLPSSLAPSQFVSLCENQKKTKKKKANQNRGLVTGLSWCVFRVSV
uniref:Uncharacterized protein n=1 Tax=Amphilophus citrinellus TaxID=61819 RepID=A0A3Q0SY55_AMPCI